MNPTLAQWNSVPSSDAIAILLHCCAAPRWAEQLTAQRPFVDEDELYQAADRVWSFMQETDWMEAFKAHPRIGQRPDSLAPVASAQSSSWSQQEQSSAEHAQQTTLLKLATDNQLYEDTFGFTYIICATGKSAEEMLLILQTRLGNSRSDELKEAAEQQRQITAIRLRKWLYS